MATPKAIIDTVVSYYDDTGTTPDPALDGRRNRLLQMLNHVHALVWNFRPWSFTYKETEAVVEAGEGSMPLADAVPDFLSFGPEGFLLEVDRHLEYHEKSKAVIQRRRNVLQPGSPSNCFAFFDGGFQFDAAFAAETDFLVFHRYRAPALIYDTTVMAFPDQYTPTVLIPALIYRSQGSKRDNRQVWGDQFQEGLSQMCILEAPYQSRGQKMPLSHRGVW